MKTKHSLLPIAVGVAAMAALSSPAFADIWWETSTGRTMFWNDTVAGAAVFTFEGAGETFYIEGIPAEETSGRMYDSNTGWVETWGGVYNGFWYVHPANSVKCEARTDPNGRTTTAWGQAQIAFSDLRHFSLSIGDCMGPLKPVVVGTPGL